MFGLIEFRLNYLRCIKYSILEYLDYADSMSPNLRQAAEDMGKVILAF